MRNSGRGKRRRERLLVEKRERERLKSKVREGCQPRMAKWYDIKKEREGEGAVQGKEKRGS